MTIAITGATGQLGRHVIGKLKQKTGADGIVALVRSLDKAQIWGWRPVWPTTRTVSYTHLTLPTKA
mgnify:CR=1 FL=1